MADQDNLITGQKTGTYLPPLSPCDVELRGCALPAYPSAREALKVFESDISAERTVYLVRKDNFWGIFNRDMNFLDLFGWFGGVINKYSLNLCSK
jgi:hypothetical protein